MSTHAEGGCFALASSAPSLSLSPWFLQRLRGTKEVDAEWEDIVEETRGTEAKRRALIGHLSSRQAGAAQ